MAGRRRTARLLVAATLGILTPLTGMVSPAVAAPAKVKVAGGCALAPAPKWEARLANLAPHPRIVFGDQDRATIARAAHDPLLRTYHARFLSRGYASSRQPVPVFTSANLNSQAAAAVARFTYIGYPLLANDDAALADRIRAEVAAIVAVPTWNTSHFLDTAHAMTAVSLGYSLSAWRMTSDERDRTLDALVSKGITPATCLWASKDFMVSSTDNWGVVTNAALTMAALVVADKDNQLAAAVIQAAVPRLNAALATMTDGGTYEGPMYANYMATYAAYVSSSLERSLGESGRVVQGVPNAAAYLTSMTGPSGLPFNHGDSDNVRLRDLLPVWNAYRGGDPAGAWFARKSLAEDLIVSPLYLLWDAGAGMAPAAMAATAVSLPQSGVISMRTGWDTDASWVAMKGGTNRVNHAQLELGTFVLEMAGQRFVSEYGRDSYSLPGYFEKARRATYFRCATVSASTLSRAGINQDWKAVAPVIAPVENGYGWTGGVDLSSVLGVKSAQRRAILREEGVVQIVDTVAAATATPLRWTANTEASVALSPDKRQASLTRNGTTITASLASSTPGTFRVLTPPATKGGLPNTGFRQLVLDTAAKVKTGASYTGTIAVTFTPPA